MFRNIGIHSFTKLFYFRILNHVVKQGTSTANTLGVISVIYSAFGVALQTARGTDDDFNTIASATATGLLYKSTGNFLLQKSFLYLSYLSYSTG